MAFSLWRPFGLDPYPLVRPFLFLLDPEFAHETAITLLRHGLGPRFGEPDDPILHSKVFDLFFPNPIGLAAGFDKQAEAIDAFMRFGFGAVEVGTVTPRPQPGNPKPRMVRVPVAKALINRFGFNSVGLDVFAERLRAWRDAPNRSRNPVGVNVGRNKDSEDESADYVQGLIRTASCADFVTVNVSSPNTPGLRNLQRRDHLTSLLSKVMEARQQHAPGLPVLVKIAPDLDDDEMKDIADVVLAARTQGLIVSNTTVSRPSIVPREVAKEQGGLSGGPLLSLSTRVLSSLYRLTQGRIPLVGCGGVSTGADAYAKIRAGASLVQIYTCLVYEGPGVVNRIKKELADLLRRDGFRSVTDAVGADHR